MRPGAGRAEIKPVKSGVAWRLGALLILRAALAGAFAERVAPFNAPDEPGHFYYIDALAASRRLPVVDLSKAKFSYEAYQPPLYYALAAPIAAAWRGRPIQACVSALRRQSIVYALINIIAIFFLGRLAAGEEAGLAAAAFSAFLPQYLFIGSTITNDGLADLCATLLILLTARELKASSSRRLKAPWLLGAIMGLALLSKLTTAGLAAATAAALALSRRPASAALTALAAPLGLAAAMAGGFYARNIRLYGDLAGYGTMTYESRMELREAGSWCIALFKSFWGNFGWMASPLPDPAYAALALASAVAAVGFAAWWRENEAGKDPLWLYLSLVIAIVLAQTVYHGFFRTRQPQGRFLFPTLGPISLAAALGGGRAIQSAPPYLRRAAPWLAASATALLEWLSWRALS